MNTEHQDPFTITQSIQTLPCNLKHIDLKLDIIKEINTRRDDEPSKFIAFEKKVKEELDSIHSKAKKAI